MQVVYFGGGPRKHREDMGKARVLWVELCPPKQYVEVLIPGIYKCDLIWKWGICNEGKRSLHVI